MHLYMSKKHVLWRVFTPFCHFPDVFLDLGTIYLSLDALRLEFIVALGPHLLLLPHARLLQRLALLVLLGVVSRQSLYGLRSRPPPFLDDSRGVEELDILQVEPSISNAISTF
jgi:hypothetical protein